MFGGSKGSLHDTIRTQQHRLAKYEKKLCDLVKAYKSLQEEKTALQETVNAFSAQPPHASNNSDEDVGTDDALKQQVTALTKTLSSLNETKNTLELRFQHDKKELLEQVDILKTGLTAEHNTLQQERSTNEGYRKDMKSKLRNEQHEREQEQTHHVAMLRELQHMLANERNSTQKLELELDDLRNSKNFEKQRSVFEDKIKLLKDERDYLISELDKTRSKSNVPSKDFILLKEEVVELRGVKAELEAVKSEQETVAFKTLHLQTTADQNRIRELENRLADLSELVAEYDVTQKRDQEEISRLRSRVTTLEHEAATKTESARVSVSVNTNVIIDTPTSPSCNMTSPPHSGKTSQGDNVTSSREMVIVPRDMISASLPLQLVSKNREVEISKLKESVRVYKQEIAKLQEEKKNQQLHLVKLTDQHKKELIEIDTQHSLEIKESEKGHASRLNELIDSSNKARLRSQDLLAERDLEISDFRSRVNPKRSPVKPGSNEENMIADLLSSVETESVPRTMVFYKQQHQYLTDELLKLKEQRDHLDQVIREKERNEHVYVTEVTNLKQEVSRLIRNTSRESANMEYLKNIVLRYLRVTNGSEKRQILLAIFTVLHFSEEEKVSVKHKLMPGWFS